MSPAKLTEAEMATASYRDWFSLEHIRQSDSKGCFDFLFLNHLRRSSHKDLDAGLKPSETAHSELDGINPQCNIFVPSHPSFAQQQNLEPSTEAISQSNCRVPYRYIVPLLIAETTKLPMSWLPVTGFV
jgi:hypothetical protein